MCNLLQELGLEHRPQIKSLLQTIPNSTFFWEEIDRALQNPTAPVDCYVMLCQDIVIGVALIVEEFDYNYFRVHYDLYPINYKLVRSGSQGYVENIVVSPIFQRFSKFFVRELHRHSEYDILYYKLKPAENSAVYRERPLNNLLHCFLPIQPLLLPEFDVQSLIAQGKFGN